MNSTPTEQVSYSDFLRVLGDLVDSGLNHVLYFRTNIGRLLTIAIKDHAIVFINYGVKRGRAALDDIKTIESGTCRVSHDEWRETDADLPTTAQILNKLAPDTKRAPAPTSVNLVDSFSGLLAGYLGPIARTLCVQVLSEFDMNEPNYAAIIERLAEEIDDPAAAEEFKKSAKALSI